MTVHIGTSGWSYAHWEGVMYPHGTPPRDRLAWYLQHFGTVELNSSYYRWPVDATFARWQRRLPPGFVLTVKAPRGLTHGQRLYAPERWLARIRHGLHHLGERRGILLVQLPPTLPFDHARLAYFLAQVNAGVIRGRQGMAGHPQEGPLRVAVEFRHPSWHREEVFALLEEAGAAYCVMSGAGLPCILRATAPFVYVRLHGPDPHHLYAGSYSAEDLRWWAARIEEWQDMGKEAFVYFNNDGAGNAVRNAASLRSLLGS